MYYALFWPFFVRRVKIDWGLEIKEKCAVTRVFYSNGHERAITVNEVQ